MFRSPASYRMRIAIVCLRIIIEYATLRGCYENPSSILVLRLGSYTHANCRNLDRGRTRIGILFCNYTRINRTRTAMYEYHYQR